MWHYVDGEESRGPVSPNAMATLIEERTVQPESLVWRDGFESWTPAAEVDELAGSFGAAPVGLQLRTAPREFTIAAADEETREAITVDTLRAPLTAMAEAENAPPQSSFFGWMFFTSPFEFRFFFFTAILAAMATGGMYFYDPVMLPLPFMIQGVLALGVGGLIFRIRTFQEHVGWGLAGLLIGVTDLAFIAMHWSRAKASVLLQLAGIAMLIGVLFGWASVGEVLEAVPVDKF